MELLNSKLVHCMVGRPRLVLILKVGKHCTVFQIILGYQYGITSNGTRLLRLKNPHLAKSIIVCEIGSLYSAKEHQENKKNITKQMQCATMHLLNVGKPKHAYFK